MPAQQCPLCIAFANVTQGDGDFLRVQCKRCGDFDVTRDAARTLELAPLEVATIGTVGGYVRDRAGLRVTVEVASTLRALRPLSIDEKAHRLLAILASSHPSPGRLLTIPCISAELQGRCWALDEVELKYLAVDYLGRELGALTLPSNLGLSNGALQGLVIAPSGWHRLAANPPGISSTAFIAMWFDGSMDALRDECLIPGIAAAGYEAVLVNRHEHVNRIDDEIVALIRRARFVVADFTGERGGVYFEAGFAMGLGIPVVWTCRASDLEAGSLHFDVNHFNFLPWDERDLPQFRAALTHRISAVIGRGPLG
ncbi:MAG: hypothetical protein IT348_05030 [Candidatus Eisenbacteria bacterium]|nr:hypothetical protein [Candidatus Eisenbacteria bacterium]